MNLDEMRLTIKLMIHSFKSKKDWPKAFAEYTKVTQDVLFSPHQGQTRQLGLVLLSSLRELLDIMVPEGLSSGDEPVLSILR